MKILLKSVRETKKVAAELAIKIFKNGVSKKGATVVGLRGDLGSGKTTFAQAFARTLGVKGRLPSPTFVFYRSYLIPRSPRVLVHADMYRVRKLDELKPLKFRELLRDSKRIVLIEWADRIKKILPKTTKWVTLAHGRNVHERFISL